ncbi:MAG: sterol desaturase family protein [Gammaproteobacteria bacterium]|nr:sterol desaturase family protein [Gammaproteobacteria bacterium]
MPTPLQLLLDPVSLTVFALFGALIALEALFPARALVPVKGWWARGLLAFAAFFFLSSYLPLVWTEWLIQYQLFDLTALGVWGGALVGVAVYELGVYGWHRAMHSNDRLWRTFHQMHHSAERLDTFGAYWFSPMDMIGFTALYSLALTLVVGVSAEAATMALYITTFFSVFQHSNIRTPRWLGYIVQRPESHSVHHQRGVHAWNYSDLPLFDMLFGTFRNPRDFAPQQGFYDGASERLSDLLRWRDVASTPLGRAE